MVDPGRVRRILINEISRPLDVKTVRLPVNWPNGKPGPTNTNLPGDVDAQQLPFGGSEWTTAVTLSQRQVMSDHFKRGTDCRSLLTRQYPPGHALGYEIMRILGADAHSNNEVVLLALLGVIKDVTE